MQSSVGKAVATRAHVRDDEGAKTVLGGDTAAEEISELPDEVLHKLRAAFSLSCSLLVAFFGCFQDPVVEHFLGQTNCPPSRS